MKGKMGIMNYSIFTMISKINIGKRWVGEKFSPFVIA